MVFCPVVSLAASIAFAHHEHWDGTGYPQGLRGKKIPLEGRITAVADVYDALSTKRPYKDALDHETCVRKITADSGSHFDPAVIQAFHKALPEIDMIRRKFAD